MMLLLLIFLVPAAIVCKSDPIPTDVLESVFGRPNNFAKGLPALSQVVPISPVSDSDEYSQYVDHLDMYAPSGADYDKFDWTLTKRVAANSQENFLLSPLGLKLALAILTEASYGTTQAELSYVLGFNNDKSVLRDKFAMILDSLQTKSTRYILNLASRIYVGPSVRTQQQFAAISERFYKTEIKNIDFNDSANASKSINDWVSNTTEGRIRNLVNADDVAGISAMVLNTIFFKGTWIHQFSPNETKPDSFYLKADMKKEVPFMKIRDTFFFSESAKFNAKILRLPYVGNKFAMYIVVPNSLTGLSDVFDGLNELRSELNYLRKHSVFVTLPKFQFEFTSVLDGVLKELGVIQAFEDTASFPGLSRGQGPETKFKISKIIQRSGIELNEIGSVVYSATEVTLENKFGTSALPYAEVIANKPFLFFIQDELTRQLLFTGRVSDPTYEDGVFKITDPKPQ